MAKTPIRSTRRSTIGNSGTRTEFQTPAAFTVAGQVEAQNHSTNAGKGGMRGCLRQPKGGSVPNFRVSGLRESSDFESRGLVYTVEAGKKLASHLPDCQDRRPKLKVQTTSDVRGRPDN